MAKRSTMLMLGATALLMVVGASYFATRGTGPPATADATAAPSASPHPVAPASPHAAAAEPHHHDTSSAHSHTKNAAPAATVADVAADSSDAPPTPPTVAPSRNRPEPDPLSDPEIVSKQQRGVKMLDLAIAQTERDLKDAEANGDDKRVTALKVRRKRLQERKRERLRDIAGDG